MAPLLGVDSHKEASSHHHSKGLVRKGESVLILAIPSSLMDGMSDVKNWLESRG